MTVQLWYNLVMDARVKAYAKLNLTLDVAGTAGGFHLLDSLVCTVGLFDLIKIKKRADSDITVEMHGMGCELLEPEKNNAYLAAKRYQSRFDCGGADIKIFKNIPVGAGMGGSSADAAGVLKGMARLFGAGSEAQLKELADGLGSDTGYMLGGGFARLKGRGERVEKIDADAKLNFLVLFPEGGVSTPQCYKLFDGLACGGGNSTPKAVDALESGNIAELGENLGNALYAPAVKLNPDIFTAAEELKSFSPLGVNMTGSGSAVYAVFETKELCEWAKSRYRGKCESMVLKSI